jgi:hypothetical protein
LVCEGKNKGVRNINPKMAFLSVFMNNNYSG